jgi:hypothetical protein
MRIIYLRCLLAMFMEQEYFRIESEVPPSEIASILRDRDADCDRTISNPAIRSCIATFLPHQRCWL